MQNHFLELNLMWKFFLVFRDLNPQPPNKEGEKVCLRGGIGKEPHHAPWNGSHWPPGLEKVIILLRATLSNLIWSVYFHQSSFRTAELSRAGYHGQGWNQGKMHFTWDWLAWFVMLKGVIFGLCPRLESIHMRDLILLNGLYLCINLPLTYSSLGDCPSVPTYKAIQLPFISMAGGAWFQQGEGSSLLLPI